MSTTQEQSTPVIKRRIAAILSRLEAEYPREITELLLLQDIVAGRERAAFTGGPFVGVRQPRRAIQMVLTEHNRPMSKQSIYERLIEGGYNVDHLPNQGKWAINDTINQMMRDKVLYSVEPHPGMAQVVGLSTPEPKKPNK